MNELPLADMSREAIERDGSALIDSAVTFGKSRTVKRLLGVLSTPASCQVVSTPKVLSCSGEANPRLCHDGGI